VDLRLVRQHNKAMRVLRHRLGLFLLALSGPGPQRSHRRNLDVAVVLKN
jgi:hypothetical protein